MLGHGGTVIGPRPPVDGVPGRRQRHVDDAAVVRVAAALHEARARHPVDEAGEPALRDHDGPAEVAHRQPARRCGVQLQEDVVPAQGEVMLFADEATAEAMFAKVGERRAADPARGRPKPTGSHRYEVYAQVSGAAVPA